MHLGTSSVWVQGVRGQLPIDPKVYETAMEFNLDPTLCMLSGGEDYELLFTVKQDDYEKVRNHPKLSVIGHAGGTGRVHARHENGPEVRCKPKAGTAKGKERQRSELIRVASQAFTDSRRLEVWMTHAKTWAPWSVRRTVGRMRRGFGRTRNTSFWVTAA